MAYEHHHQSPVQPHKRSLADVDSKPAFPHTSNGAIASTSNDGALRPPKKRITRRRVILSCKNCTSRKIRCEREGGPGTPCKACEKRGDATTCDAGAQSNQPRQSLPSSAEPPVHSSAGCADHRADLERRLSVLEAALLHNAPDSAFSSPGEHGRSETQEGPDSETEDAAMTLEDIAVNVRVSNSQGPRRTASARLSSTPATPYAPLPPNAGRSREMTSLLVPEISRRFRGVLADLYESMPSRPKMDWLVAHYCSSVSWFWVAHHQPIFLGEYDAFHLLLQEGRQLEIDPLWIATLFLTLAHSASSLDYLPPGSPFTPSELVAYVPAFFEAARAALDCGDAFGSAKLRAVQAIVLLAPLSLNSGNPVLVDVLIPYLAAGIRLCQQLQLDTLGNDPKKMPSDDPALPTGSSTLKREMAIRLFQALSHIDQVTFRCRPVMPLPLVDCSMPGNFSDNDLLPDAITSPQPTNVRTISAYETLRFRVGIIQRRYHDQIVLEPGYDYSTVLQLDADLRSVMAEYDLERPEPNETTTLFWARIFSLQNCHIRRIRFHRPFMSRGYRETTFRKSTDAALGSARVVLEMQKELDRTNAPLVKDCYQLNHLQVAIVCLFLDIWQNHDPEGAVPTSDYRLVSDASLCFHRALNSIRERVRAVARQSLLVIQCLFQALHARTPQGRKEPFAVVLKRVSAAVAEAVRHAASSLAFDNAAAHSQGPDDASSHPYYTPQAPPPQSNPITGDGRSLLVDTGTPVFAVSPFPAPESLVGSTASFSPGELQFGDLQSEWGFSWIGPGFG
ncbi:hypothetical protein JCM11641_001975 [Rhodosporidiobolus odoratus]